MKKPIMFDPIHAEFLLSTEDARILLDVMSRAKVLEYNWDDSRVNIKDRPDLHSHTFSSQKYDDIAKAQVLGMSYRDYLDAEQESTNSLPTD
jgi:hypothetical protein